MSTNELNGRFVRANEAFCNMLGYSEAELLTKTDIDVTYEQDLARSHEARRSSIAGSGHLDTIEKRYVRKDGKVVWGLLNRTLVKDGNGQPHHFENQILDVTDRKNSEELLRESEKILRDERLRMDVSLSTAMIGTWEWNIRDDTHFWDDRLKAMFGIFPEKFKGFMADDFLYALHTDDVEVATDAINNVIESKKDYDVDFRVVWPDDSIHWMNSRAELYQCSLTITHVPSLEGRWT
jgi:two-component system sensor histidine kinase/response regulator